MRAARVPFLLVIGWWFCPGTASAQERTYWTQAKMDAERALRAAVSTRSEQQRKDLAEELAELSKAYSEAALDASKLASSLRRSGKEDEAGATATKAHDLDRRADAASNASQLVTGAAEALVDPEPAYEAVVNVLNPMLPVCKGDVSFRGRHNGWQNSISRFFASYPRYSDSVARLEVSEKMWVDTGKSSTQRYSQPSPGGTGFSISPRLVVTAWHVFNDRRAAVLKPDGSADVKPGFKWRANFGGEDSCRTGGGVAENRPMIDIEAIVKVDSANDIAVVRLSEDFTDGVPLPIEAMPKLVPDDEVAVMGFPGRDVKHYEMAELKILLRVDEDGNYKFDVKRFQPGFVKDCTGLGAGFFGHDATTLGNNSGSPVFSLTTGKVVGIHSRGLDRVCNYAESSAALAQALTGLADAPVIQTASNP